MTVKTIAILSPGDMGHGVGRALGESGFDVITCLEGRSQRTRDLAGIAKIRDVPSLEELVRQADLILSILVPSQASGIAAQVADALRSTGENTYYADCNAVSPQTSSAMSRTINAAGGRYIDGGIIGGSPSRSGEPPRFYVSGEYSAVMEELDGKGITVRNIGGAVGRATSVKMCYAALTKGTNTLQVALLTAAEALGISSELMAEFEFSQKAALAQMRGISRLPANAHRWIGEMEEIAATFDGVGVTPAFHQGAAEMYRLLAQTSFANEAPEQIDRSRPASEIIQELVRLLPTRVESAD
jgi:3-hydroxyisobutyrate dehydrogenase-like beta-hydroxyacid dehydrogenase